MLTTILSIIAGVVSIALLILKASSDQAKLKKDKQDAIDKKIDAASDADDIMRASGELRND